MRGVNYTTSEVNLLREHWIGVKSSKQAFHLFSPAQILSEKAERFLEKTN
jgi:hypothetical protein